MLRPVEGAEAVAMREEGGPVGARRRLSSAFVVVIAILSINPAPAPFDLPEGFVVMSTDKPCYRANETVNITATGWAEVPSIGDFPGIFWAIRDASGNAVFETANPFDAIGTFNGTLSGSWNLTYRRLFGGQQPTGTPVPPGRYLVGFYELPPPGEDWPNWVVPAEIEVGSCDGPSVDAGPDRAASEGEPLLFAAGGVGNGNETWRDRAAIPITRPYLAGAALDGKAYALGGFRGDEGGGVGSLADVHVYDPGTDAWANATPMPIPLHKLAAAILGGKLYVVGGLQGDNDWAHPWNASGRLFAYDPGTGGWEERAPLPFGRHSLALVAHGNRLYAFGGSTNYETLDAVEAYDLATDTWSPRTPMPVAGLSMASAVLGGRVYLIGGYPWGRIQRVDVYDPGADAWSTAKSLPDNRTARGLTAQPMDGRIVVVGGYGFDCATPIAFAYDPLQNAWSPFPPPRYARVWAASAVLGGTFHLFGGTAGWNCPNVGPSEAFLAGPSLAYTWDFDASADSDGDGNSTNDVDATGPTPTWTYGDDGVFTVTLRVTDAAGKSATDTAIVTVANVAPSIALSPVAAGHEGDGLAFSVQVLDPGSDDLALTWSGECAGWSPTSYPNDPARVPDPDPSPDVHPRNVTDAQTVVCGDDGTFAWSLRAEDDDGGVTTLAGTFPVANLPPAFAYTYCPQIVGCDPTRLEGAATSYAVHLDDPGSDDVSLLWSWDDGSPTEAATYFNDGLGPDPPHSPNGTFPFPVADTRGHAYGDDGDYEITVLAADDDGGQAPTSAVVTILNVPPSLAVSPPSLVTTEEGTAVTLEAIATDPGSDDLTFAWRWSFGPSEARTYYNDGLGPDPPRSPRGAFPFTAADRSAHTYGDDCPCEVTLTVQDDDGGALTYTTTVQVANVAPEVVGEFSATATGNLTLRVAGEKWHDVVLTLYDRGSIVGTASVVRAPGSPDEQSATILEVMFDPFSTALSATVEYTTLDDPANGEVWGADPAWLILTAEDGTEVRIQHTFNVRHPETWRWSVDDLRTLLVGFPIRFEATARDVGSDDLAFRWSWGDGTPDGLATYFNDGIGPDSFPSPDIHPIMATDATVHAFAVPGTYTVVLTVTDDDSGAATHAVTLRIG